MKILRVTVILLVLVFWAAITFAQPLNSDRFKVKGGKIIHGPIVLKADLKVKYFDTAPCPCSSELAKVDALYISRIVVFVENDGPFTAKNVKLKVSYFDITKNRVVTVVKNLGILSPRPKAGWYKKVTVVNRSLLVKKSVGIKAEISGDKPDPNPNNNVLVVKECSWIVE